MINAVRHTIVRTSRSLITPGLEQRRHLGQPITQRHPAMGLGQRQPLADALTAAAISAATAASGSTHQQSRVLGIVEAGAPAEQLGHRRQLARTRRVLRPRPATHGVH